MHEGDGRAAALEAIGGPGIVAILRVPRPDGVLEACRALAAGGVRAIEITLTIPGALGLIEAVTHEVDSVAVGAGTVLDARQCRSALAAGASFVVSPGFDAHVLQECATAGVLAVPGCLTPTEVVVARRAGAELIKLFPARAATPEYLADLLGPFPGLRLLPTGGIDAAAAAGFTRAGAFAVGIGASLADPADIRARHREAIRARAEALVAAVRGARSGSGAPI